MKMFLILVAFFAFQGYGSPVEKVVKLLEQMADELEGEVEKDHEVHDTMQCWCTTNDSEKTESISAAKQAIDSLNTDIETFTAKSARLESEIADLEGEIKESQDSLAAATKQRQKELDSFSQEEKDLLQAIKSLDSAITVLSKHNSLASVKEVLKMAMSKHATQLATVLTPSERRAVEGFLQVPGFKSYSSQSGQIFGILKNMKDSFEGNLSADNADELAKQTAFNEYKKAREESIKTGQNQRDDKKMQLAQTNTANVQAQEQLEDISNSLSADEKYLVELKIKCEASDKEFADRMKSRNEEIQGVHEAIKILSADDARDNFSKTFKNPAFFQLSGDSRMKASKLLSDVGSKNHNAGLVELSSSVRLDAFEKVKATIQDMVIQLQQEQSEEVKSKDNCNQLIHENRSESQKLAHNIKKTNATLDQLVQEKDGLETSIKSLTKEVSTMEVNIKRAGENREKENLEFHKTVTEQRQTLELLQNALNVLKKVFAKKKVSLLQQRRTEQPVGPAAPEGFEDYAQNKNSGGVMGMLQGIIQEASAVMKEVTRDESDSQASYESLVKELNNSIDQKNKQIADESGDLAATESSIETESSTKSDLEDAIETSEKTNKDLHSQCDFILNNFGIRQQARNEEIEALRQATSILSGMK